MGPQHFQLQNLIAREVVRYLDYLRKVAGLNWILKGTEAARLLLVKRGNLVESCLTWALDGDAVMLELD